MSTQTKCDVCDRVIVERSAGWITITTRRTDTVRDFDVCSAGCGRLFWDDEFPHRRPDFRAAHLPLSNLPVTAGGAQRITASELAGGEDTAAVDALERAVDTGEYGEPDLEEAI